jgi:hypothetical protein
MWIIINIVTGQNGSLLLSAWTTLVYTLSASPTIVIIIIIIIIDCNWVFTRWQ